jgi:hypothetical protein
VHSFKRKHERSVLNGTKIILLRRRLANGRSKKILYSSPDIAHMARNGHKLKHSIFRSEANHKYVTIGTRRCELPKNHSVISVHNWSMVRNLCENARLRSTANLRTFYFVIASRCIAKIPTLALSDLNDLFLTLHSSRPCHLNSRRLHYCHHHPLRTVPSQL